MIGGAPQIRVDVGANEGQTLRAFLEWWPNSRCISFEPHPAAFGVLAQTASQFEPRAIVRNYGVSDTTGGSLLFASKSEPTQSSFKRVNRSADTVLSHRGLRGDKSAVEIAAHLDEEQIEVEVVTLDTHLVGCEPEFDWTKNGIDVLKSDTQGWELSVLREARQTLARTRVVLVEWQFDDIYGTPPPLSELDSTLTSSGFRLWDIAHIYKELSSLRTLWVDLVYARQKSED